MTDKELLKLCNERLNYNPETGIFIWKISSGRAGKGRVAGAKHSAGYENIQIKGIRVLSHRIAFLMCYGYLPEFIDHINNIRNDNRIKNLRPATRCDNQSNQKINSRNKSGLKGVCWNKGAKKWSSYICSKGVRKFLGYYTCKHEASEAYIRESNKLHGKYGNY